MAAALGTFGAGALLVNLPAGADTKTVSYNCTSSTSQSTPHQVTVSLTGSSTTATAGTVFTATLVISAANPAFNAAEAIPAGANIQIIPQVSISATPAQPTVREVLPTASAPVAAALQPGAALAPIPTVTVSVTPPVGATSMVLNARSFTLRVAQAGATTGADLYTCQIATTGNTAPAAVTAAVTGTSTGTPTPTPTNTTPTPTATTPTPQGTRTVEVTVTADESKGSKVERTPNGGAATGAGGDAGPDGRTFVLAGSLMVLGAAAGGLALRRRRLARG